MVTARAWDLLADVTDPEIPVLSVLDLGIVRAVDESSDGHAVTVTLTPTYSGCPATEVIAHDVRAALESSYEEVEVRTQLSPAWTTDWMSEEAKQKLNAFGIAPPSGTNVVDLGATIGRRGGNPLHAEHVRTENEPERCPQCGSIELEPLSQFGSTPCKALWRCSDCGEPFDYFKRH
jgi:ring-1,2-phenylacetyl-CoA epoxidase subunit PaaD